MNGFAANGRRRPAQLPFGAIPRPAMLAFALALVAPFSSLVAQQNAGQQPPQQNQQNAPATSAPETESPSTPQQPGARAQLHTGTSSGLDTDARFENLLADHQYLRVQAQLDQLPPEQAQFYRGILANRSNQLEQSVQLLEPLVEKVSASGDTAREKLLRMTLAEDYLRLGDWAKAAQAYQTLDDRLHANLSSGEQDEIEMPLKMLPLVRDNPPITDRPLRTVQASGQQRSSGPYRCAGFYRRAVPQLDARPHCAIQSDLALYCARRWPRYLAEVGHDSFAHRTPHRSSFDRYSALYNRRPANAAQCDRLCI